MALDAFDYAVIEYSDQSGIDTEEIYKQIDKVCDNTEIRGIKGRYRDSLTIPELLQLLEKAKEQNQPPY